MKKCILIGALAALMLFAFTACEQPGLTLPANVDYITVVQTKDFVDGDKFSAANFTVYAHDTNGGNTPVNGAKVEIDSTGEALATGNTVEAGTTYTVKATLNVATSESPLTATQTFTAYALESYSVTGAPTLVAYLNEKPAVKAVATSTVDQKAIKISGVYANGETRELNANDVISEVIDNLYVTDAEGNKIEASEFVVGATYYLSVGYDQNAILTNISMTAVAEKPEGPSDNFVRYEYKVTSKGYYGETLAWTIYEVSEQDKSEKDWTPVASSTDWGASSDATSSDWVVMSYSDGDSSTKDDGLEMPTEYGKYEQTITLRNIANASRSAVTMKFDAGKDAITTAFADLEFTPVTTLIQSELDNSLSVNDIQAEIDRLIPVYGKTEETKDEPQQQYLPTGNYSIEKQSVDKDGNWTGIVKVTYTYLNTTGYTETSVDRLLTVNIEKNDLPTTKPEA